ncbi:phage tail sheath family protein [Methylobacillus arboreus]|uniref:phage tail sheath family protein n=1 Tax=Methylobacillus arboreus TaxID=755170 RepID=UPI001E53EC0A|nr:phage tail sheath C-terminal domain-containing protein [Methylobacillus arboreus]MCB5191718.1 phage tail sheath family protein [Methylobacillus arboreus]
MGNHQYPGVYVEEIPQIPASAEAAATCLPLFIGYTEKSVDRNGASLPPGQPYSITSLAEYEQCFGKGAPETLQVVLDGTGRIVNAASYSPFYLHACIQQYFANGGGLCEILSVGPYPKAPDTVTLESAISRLPASAAFTMVAIPDAICLPKLPQLQHKLLQYCQQQDHCLAILDVPYCNDQTLPTTVATFRDSVGKQWLRHGAAFLPWLEIAQPRAEHYEDLEIKYTPGVAAAWNQYHKATRLQSRLLHKRLEESPDIAIGRMIPPNGTIIGLFHAHDRNRGIWKTPSQVPINEVLGLSASITDNIQEPLNIDKHEGKSINAIRKFNGRGILMWGARTLAGNDHEWRYISQVRTRSFVLASLRRHLVQQNFETNDERTWARIRQSYHAFLHKLWQDGGLSGDKPEHAFYVRAGLNQTMTSQDISAGRLIIEVGIALAKPAEFIILRIQQATPTAEAAKPGAAVKDIAPSKKVRVRAKTSPINVTVKPAQYVKATKPRPLESS